MVTSVLRICRLPLFYRSQIPLPAQLSPVGKVGRCSRVSAVIALRVCWEGDEVVGVISSFGAGVCIAWDCLQCHVVCVSPLGEDVMSLLA